MTNKQGQTALFHVAELGRTAVVKYLLEHGAKVDLKDDAGKTALDAARGEGADGRATPPGRQEIVALLTGARSARD
jgi:ankyrin repeat protein